MYKTTTQGAVHIVHGNAPMTADTEEAFLTAIEVCLSSGRPMAVVDLHETALIDSAGLECLLEANERFAVRGGELKLARAQELIVAILYATGVGRRFDVFKDVNSAVRSFLQ